MNSDSEALTEWLNQVLADQKPTDSDEGYDEALDDEEDSGVRQPRLIWYFPTDEMCNEYISNIDSRSEEEVRKVIERLLIPTGAFGLDRLNFEIYIGVRDGRIPVTGTTPAEMLAVWEKSDYWQALIKYFGGISDDPPWQGIKWVTRLLPDRPRHALNTIEAYVYANASSLSDHMVDALGDAETVIRARYIGVPGSTEGRVQTLYDLTSREFEQVVEHLYAAMKYKTQLTPAISDGGRDIIATSSTSGRREHLLIECKRYQGRVRIETVRSLLGIVATELANKGVLVTTSGFTRGARKLESDDLRLELIDGPHLVLLLNEYLGATWPARIEYYTRPLPS